MSVVRGISLGFIGVGIALIAMSLSDSPQREPGVEAAVVVQTSRLSHSTKTGERLLFTVSNNPQTFEVPERLERRPELREQLVALVVAGAELSIHYNPDFYRGVAESAHGLSTPVERLGAGDVLVYDRQALHKDDGWLIALGTGVMGGLVLLVGLVLGGLGRPSKRT